MKKELLIISLFLFLFACKKEEDPVRDWQCYDCIRIYLTNDTPGAVPDTIKEYHCSSLSDYQTYIKTNNWTYGKLWSKLTCVKSNSQ